MIFVYMFLSEKISVKLVSVCPYSDMKKERKKDKECYRKNLKSGTSFPAKNKFLARVEHGGKVKSWTSSNGFYANLANPPSANKIDCFFSLMNVTMFSGVSGSECVLVVRRKADFVPLQSPADVCSIFYQLILNTNVVFWII